MDAFARPCRLVVRVQAETNPKMLAPFSGLLLRKCFLDHDITILKEELHLLRCIVGGETELVMYILEDVDTKLTSEHLEFTHGRCCIAQQLIARVNSLEDSDGCPRNEDMSPHLSTYVRKKLGRVRSAKCQLRCSKSQRAVHYQATREYRLDGSRVVFPLDC